mmetsp:Transcript_45844/g.127242  ORF Transcript_45844/g.127242 Transcript_45844/m.127242 type:complete len:162 (-) Transcript_45844:105-590(-)
MSKFEYWFDLSSNRFTRAIPTQLGRFTKLTHTFELNNNQICGEVPTEVQALSNNVNNYWQVTTGNDIGTDCPSLPTQPPTMVPETSSPTLGPTATVVPTLAPTYCGPGFFEDYDSDGTGRGCVLCPMGKSNGLQSAPICTVCGAGKIAAQEGSVSCELCPG